MHLRWKTRGFPEMHELDLSLPVHERNKAALLLSLSNQDTRVPTSADLIGKPVQGCKVSRLLILTSGVVRRSTALDIFFMSFSWTSGGGFPARCASGSFFF